jgi:hypothetical protein
MAMNNKKPFWKSFYFPMILFLIINIGIILFAAFYTPDRKKPDALRLYTKNARCVYIGNVNGTSMDAYKLTVDSVDYILIQSNQGITLTKVN